MIKLTAETFAARFPALATLLEAGELETFVKLLKVQELEASEALIAEGTETDSLFFLWDGELNIVMNTPEGERQVARISDNEMMGEISLMSSRSRHCDCSQRRWLHRAPLGSRQSGGVLARASACCQHLSERAMQAGRGTDSPRQ